MDGLAFFLVSPQLLAIHCASDPPPQKKANNLGPVQQG